MKASYCFLFVTLFSLFSCTNQRAEPLPRVVISTDIGGTDPDDNQSLAHLMMYSDLFRLEGIISSPSFGDGNKEEILRMIDLYEQDFPALHRHTPSILHPDSLRAITKQGARGAVGMEGWRKESSEGAQWIVKCARRESKEPLWVLVWGGLDDLAQALHDAPDIAERIKVYWIGGPNKKWSVNSYTYIVENFPNLWMIENNASYRGFISDNKKSDRYNQNYYEEVICGAGHLGADFKTYYKGVVKMGDTPSLLYLMDGQRDNPEGESWGGSFEPCRHSARHIFHRLTTEADTVSVYSVTELHLAGPRSNLPKGTPCLTLTIDKQEWDGYYVGDGEYLVRYANKAPARLPYTITSHIPALNGLQGVLVVDGTWPERPSAEDWPLGESWYTDKQSPELFEDKWQGAKTTSKHRNEALNDWAVRWGWLKE